MGVDFQQTELALDDLQGRAHVGCFQGDVCAAKDLVAGRDLDKQFGHPRNWDVALAS